VNDRDRNWPNVNVRANDYFRDYDHILRHDVYDYHIIYFKFVNDYDCNLYDFNYCDYDHILLYCDFHIIFFKNLLDYVSIFNYLNDYERINLYDKIIYLIDFVINFIFDDFFCSSHLFGVHGNRHFFEKGI
jgi:hypothetical protein